MHPVGAGAHTQERQFSAGKEERAAARRAAAEAEAERIMAEQIKAGMDKAEAERQKAERMAAAARAEEEDELVAGKAALLIQSWFRSGFGAISLSSLWRGCLS